MNRRIKLLRNSLDLTQQKFADRLGVKGNTISQYESGRNAPVDSVISLICREFNVSERWLRTGEGEMFVPAPSNTLDVLTKEYELSHDARVLVEEFVNLKPEMQQVFIDFARKAAESFRSAPAGKDITVSSTVEQERTMPDIAAELAELKQQNMEIMAQNKEKDKQLQDLAAKVAAMEEEDALPGLTDAFSKSPSASVGNISPAQKTKA